MIDEDIYFVSDYRSARLVIGNRSGKLPNCWLLAVVEISCLSRWLVTVERYDVDCSWWRTSGWTTRVDDPEGARSFFRMSHSREERTNGRRRRESLSRKSGFPLDVDRSRCWSRHVFPSNLLVSRRPRDWMEELRELLKGSIERERKINDNHRWK